MAGNRCRNLGVGRFLRMWGKTGRGMIVLDGKRKGYHIIKFVKKENGEE